ncbi:MAG: serine/threonine protein kinase, partial [Bryobacterales bacterium]|nr:serine/threonine protein kinase [Bryobacterales bacterium]
MRRAGTPTIQELERAFQEALDMDAAGRTQYLDRVCAGRPDFRSRLDEMLAADQDAQAQFLETPLLQSLPAALPGEQFGRWRLEEQVGEGGLGVVYRGIAVEDGVTVEAAIKILRPGFDAGMFRDRFQQERQILAGLDHPGIARLIDCGADSFGRSFLAMEYVRGDGLTEYLSRPHPLKERLAVFDSICETVQYLHARLVVHGDIKPGNVILTPAGHAKLLDFGTARLVQGGAPGEGGMTRLLLTPHYASPEQKRGEGPSIPSDIYSLGRLLDDMVSKTEGGRDLSAISRHCQAEQPAERYQSVGALLEDLRRYREGFPVRARKATTVYAFSRFVRRQWAVVTLSSLLAAALLSGWWMANRSAERANRLAHELERSLAASLASRRLAEQRLQEAERNRSLAAQSRQQAEQAALAAQRSASQFRSLATQLLDNGQGNFAIMGEQVEANERSLRRLLMELERDPGTSGYRELVAVWTRLGALLCLKGNFPEGLAALEKAQQLAAAWRAREPSDESRTAYVLNLVYGVRYQQLRGNRAAARHDAARAMAEFDKLPAALRE